VPLGEADGGRVRVGVNAVANEVTAENARVRGSAGVAAAAEIVAGHQQDVPQVAAGRVGSDGRVSGHVDRVEGDYG